MREIRNKFYLLQKVYRRLIKWNGKLESIPLFISSISLTTTDPDRAIIIYDTLYAYGDFYKKGYERVPENELFLTKEEAEHAGD